MKVFRSWREINSIFKKKNCQEVQFLSPLVFVKSSLFFFMSLTVSNLRFPTVFLPIMFVTDLLLCFCFILILNFSLSFVFLFHSNSKLFSFFSFFCVSVFTLIHNFFSFFSFFYVRWCCHVSQLKLLSRFLV